MTSITLHALQAVPASLVNRDEVGATKTISYGGTTRVRVSSQSWKRAMRTDARRRNTDLPWGTRTARLPQMTAERLPGERADEAVWKTGRILEQLGFKIGKDGRTAVLMFVNDNTPETLARVVNQYWDQISDTTVPDQAVAAARQAIDPGKAVDIALFGRFLAEIPDGRVDAAAHVAHAFSVDPARIMPDFFTAVDDQTPGDEPGVANLGDVDLSAPILYRTAAVDTGLLAHNLAGDQTLTRKALQVFVDTFTESFPSAKAGSTAAATLPSFVLGVAGQRETSLADAFAQAIDDPDVMGAATRRLLAWASMVASFGGEQKMVAMPITADLDLFGGVTVRSDVPSLVDCLVDGLLP